MVWKLLIHHLSLIIRKSSGFTLVELMVVLSITAVLGTLGIAGFTTYNQIQVLQASTNDLVTTLNLAKSRALSQVKLGTDCEPATRRTLDSYEVAITIIPSSYSLKVNCHDGESKFSNEIINSKKSLPKGVIFDSVFTKPTTFTFPILVGGVSEDSVGKIKLSAYGRNKIIKINSLGGISVQ